MKLVRRVQARNSSQNLLYYESTTARTSALLDDVIESYKLEKPV